MKSVTQFACGSVFLMLLNATVVAGDAKDDAIKKERMRYAGTWQVESVEVDGNKFPDEQAKTFKVINEADGKWAIEQDGKVIARGTSVIDPTKKVKTVDLTQTEGAATEQTLLGIYELTDDTRKVCFAPPGKDRPTEFSSPAGSGHLLVVLKKEKK
jgi:uncharacterized protein (TIGR03067 family)